MLGSILLFASETVNLADVPQYLADNLGVGLIGGQMIASLIFLCLVLFPTMLLTNKRSNQYISVLIVGIGCLGTLVGIGWLHYWFLLIIVVIVALMFSGTMRDFLGGK